jgi:predicted nucleic acid-binding protein
MANEIFIDSSGFYTMLASDDDRHAAAARILSAAGKRKRRFVTTDYVLDETATLFRARRKNQLVFQLFDRLDQSQACRIEWTDSDRFHEVRTFFVKHADQDWSFTDCLSFRVMSELRLRDALTKDAHFEQAGFAALLK